MIPAPPLETTQWFNSDPLTLAGLRGKVVVLGIFQMLCPGCVSSGLPQLQRVYEGFDRKQIAVISLHTVFEHHTAMTPIALAAFLHEYRLSFPVAVDAPSPNADVPVTMARYGFQGTPSLALIDKTGRLRLKRFGHEPDLQLGAAITRLILEDSVSFDYDKSADKNVSRTCLPGAPCI
jgi:thiol-disulfide isomerase/thioredoxin